MFLGHLGQPCLKALATQFKNQKQLFGLNVQTRTRALRRMAQNLHKALRNVQLFYKIDRSDLVELPSNGLAGELHLRNVLRYDFASEGASSVADDVVAPDWPQCIVILVSVSGALTAITYSSLNGEAVGGP
eukprot:CAMPEP_0206432256 /NCGR_PEP_ID=MMETSP0324_2-20121206/7817_1 /ASSEMBLY_ACC=CAM_ASM_000836 /TAXON_ID=2866 /ORGANISM="Crypthecodinium cohnii, Strain Seligo" /LENGTH=130 /DNA_ID=CAMNT_0053898271 /DNA_START=949 /DNA_END=1341 /DNA_ORIENTATION=-